MAETEINQRRDVMRLCAEATREELRIALVELGPMGPSRDLRRPESGLVMLRGRAGGDGRPFNVGEATVTRAAVTVDHAPTGLAYHLGRDVDKARDAALVDALWQMPERRDAVEAVLDPIKARIDGERDLAARRTAATRVNFFTLVRGED